jgi:hypothetical protein
VASAARTRLARRGGALSAWAMLASMTPKRKRVALAIAVLADAVQLGFFPVFGAGALSIPDDVLDFGVAVALVITLGWRWRLVAALAFELVPGLALFPSWTVLVATLPAVPAPLSSHPSAVADLR